MKQTEALEYSIRISTRGRVLVDVRDFRIEPGSLTILFGESGIGKSLIARAIYGLLDPMVFDVTINDQPYDSYMADEKTIEIRKQSFFVFQEPSSHLNPLLPIRTQLKEGSLAEAPDERELLDELWDRPDYSVLRALLETYPKPHRPSGGEKQRMLLVMALKKIEAMLEQPDLKPGSLFVFDEPTGSLDNHFRDIFFRMLMKRLRSNILSTLLITHDYSIVGLLARDVPQLKTGVVFQELRTIEGGNGRVILQKFEQDTYLEWLEDQEPLAPSGKHGEGPLLRLTGSTQVFGRSLTVTRDQAGKEACALEVYPGEIVYLKARSGVGKTTLLKVIMGLTRAERFEAELKGRRLTEETLPDLWQKEIWGKSMTMVFQHADEAVNPHSRVREILEGLPLENNGSGGGLRDRLGEFFDTGLDDSFLDKQIMVLSGGQKQRLNLLRAFALDTDILLLDEPLNGLDFESMSGVLDLIRRKQEAGAGILLVSHNEEIIDRVVEKGNVYYLHSSSDPVRSR